MINFLHGKVIMKDEKIIRNFYAKPTDTHQYLDSSSCQPDQCKMVPLTAKLYALIEFVLIMPSLIRDVTNKIICYMKGDIVKELLGKKY